MRILLAAILLALVMSAAADADPPAVLAQAQQPQCAGLQEIEDGLRSEYGESPAGIMESHNGPLLIFSNPETTTFTIIVLKTPFIGCPVTSGDHFQIIPQKPAKPAEMAP